MIGRSYWIKTLISIVALGLLSRRLPVGQPLWDKYLGDSLYAGMVYSILRLCIRSAPWKVAVASSAIMIAIECFQLTGIPNQMWVSINPALRILGRVLGTQFSVLDLIAYAIGIFCIFLVDRRRSISSRNLTPPCSI